MHRCPKVVTFQFFVDTGIEGAEHLNQAALAWKALLSPAVAVVENIHEHSYAALIKKKKKQVLLRSNLIYLILFLTARRMIFVASVLLYWDETFSPSRRQDEVTGNTRARRCLN